MTTISQRAVTHGHFLHIWRWRQCNTDVEGTPNRKQLRLQRAWRNTSPHLHLWTREREQKQGNPPKRKHMPVWTITNRSKWLSEIWKVSFTNRNLSTRGCCNVQIMKRNGLKSGKWTSFYIALFYSTWTLKALWNLVIGQIIWVLSIVKLVSCSSV